MGVSEQVRSDLDPRAAVLLELAAGIMKMGSGPWLLEARFEDGHLRSYRRNEGPLGRNALERYDEVARSA